MRKAVALDIDGVLLRGGKVIHGAKEAVHKLAAAKIPFIFVSNGGGVLEEVKAEQLSAKLSMHIRKEQILLCHSPFAGLARKHGHETVLVLGKDSCLGVARSYGFQHLLRPIDYFHHNHHILPTRSPDSAHCSSSSMPAIGAAMIFHDPVDWSLDMQLLSDLLVRGSPAKQTIPLYASNLDLVYNNEHPLPRYTQGAFLTAFAALFQQYHHIPLSIEKYGKPYRIQYEYAERMLRLEAERMHGCLPSQYYGIGDNPHSDIQGANNAGEHWQSVLVRTGIFQSSEANDRAHPADHVCLSVSEAVDLVISSP